MNAMSHNIQEYQKDGNFGLIKQLLKKYSQKEIMKLTQTYITLNLQDIANQSKNTNVNVNAAIKQAEHTIFQMVRSASLFMHHYIYYSIVYPCFMLFLFHSWMLML